ncbi:hypothetical protein GCM10010320_67900 [Streptomyces caelestis]|nr:hypothetical protein GCM10010320_67900 [Streptomyces caelestis]
MPRRLSTGESPPQGEPPLLPRLRRHPHRLRPGPVRRQKFRPGVLCHLLRRRHAGTEQGLRGGPADSGGQVAAGAAGRRLRRGRRAASGRG